MDKKEYYDNCEKCGRSWPKASPTPCPCSCSTGVAEYGKKVAGCIRNKNPECPYNAVIPQVTVDDVSGIKNLRDCFVHVSSINTTFYIDDKGRMMITWAGPVSIEDYDYRENPLNLRSQFLYTTEGSARLLFFFDKQGKYNLIDIDNIEIDNELSLTSKNAVQNKVITEALEKKQDTLTAGKNITIEGNVISATGEGGDATLYDETGDNTDGAMTQRATTAELNKLSEELATKADAADLADYATSEDLASVQNTAQTAINALAETTGEALEKKQNTLTAGENITIVEDPYTETTVISAIGGGGGSSELTTDLTVSNPIGKYEMNDVIDAGTSLETILRGMLAKTYYPTLTNPSATLAYYNTTLLRVGATIAAQTATVGLNRGSISPAYGTSGFRSGEATGFTLATSGAATDYNETQTTGSFSVPALTRTSKGNIVVTATANYAAGEQPKDSDGGNYQTALPAGSVSTTKTYEFILPFYYGASNSATVSSLTGLTENLSKKGQKTFNYTTSNQYMVIAYDATYGDLTSIIDPNGFEVIGGWSKSALTVDGQNYAVWTANLATTDTNAAFTFKF